SEPWGAPATVPASIQPTPMSTAPTPATSTAAPNASHGAGSIESIGTRAVSDVAPLVVAPDSGASAESDSPVDEAAAVALEPSTLVRNAIRRSTIARFDASGSASR